MSHSTEINILCRLLDWSAPLKSSMSVDNYYC